MTDVQQIIHDIEAVIEAIHWLNPRVSALITVKNHSNQLLWKITEGNDHGRFATDRALSIPPGAIDTFGVVSRENSIGTGVEGRIKYNAGGMGQAEWTIHWTSRSGAPTPPTTSWPATRRTCTRPSRTSRPAGTTRCGSRSS